MPHRVKNLFSLARGKVRASWNPRNLYNLYKKTDFLRNEKTLYQQKWASKRELRAYHGEHIREGTMTQQIPKKLQGVVLPLGDDVTSRGIMANAGRGPNEMYEVDADGNRKLKTPFALQTFAHLEKRLDFAVFRSMFASSVRQAGQFIRQGNVTVNGVKVKHASYPLKAGDLLSVEPEKVLFASGKAKPSVEDAVKVDNRQIKKYNQFLKKCNDNPDKMWGLKQDKKEKRAAGTLKDPKRQQELQQKNEQAFQKMLSEIRALSSAGILEDLIIGRQEFLNTQTEDTRALGEQLLKLIDQKYPPSGATPAAASTENFLTADAVVEFLNQRSTQVVEKQQQIAAAEKSDNVEKKKAEQVAENAQRLIELRNRTMSFMDSDKAFDFKFHPKDINHTSGMVDAQARKIVSHLLTLRKSEYNNVDERKVAYAARSLINEMKTNISNAFHDAYWETQNKLTDHSRDGSATVDPQWLNKLGPLREKLDASAAAEAEADVAKTLDLPWQKQHLYGRKDTSKPYFTPWRFRPFMSPSVIYPHHIEVDFKTCSAVYLRDPVSRPGMSEVISPFPLTTHEFANLYYIKK